MRIADEEALLRMVPRHWVMVLVALSLACCGPGGWNPGGTSAPPTVPRFAYVVDSGGVISSFAVDPATGQLRHNGYALSPVSISGSMVTPNVAPALVVNPSGFIHTVARSPTPTLVVASIDGPTGILTPRTLTWTGAIPLDIVAHPSGRFVYVADVNSNIQAASVDSSNGNVTAVGAPLSLNPIGSINRLAVDPQGTFVLAAGLGGAFPNFIPQVGTVVIDQATGAPTGQWRRRQLPFEPGAVVIHPTGRCGLALPQTPGPQIAAFAIASTGVPTSVVTTTVAANFVDLAFDPQGATLFALTADGVTAFPITDGTTCALGTKVGPVALYAFGNTRLSVDPSGRFVYATNPGFNQVSALAIGPGPTLTSAGSFLTRPGVTSFAPVFTKGTSPVSYLPMFLYVANYGSNDISIFSIGSAGGALTAVGSRTSLGAGPFAIAVDPWSRFAFVANRDSGTVAAFTINRSTGALSATAPAVSAGTRPVALAIDSSGRFLFVANNGSANVRAFAINQTTGQLTAPPGAGPSLTLPVVPQPTSVTVDPTGTFLYVSQVGPVAGTGLLSTFIINQIGATLGSSGQSASITVTGYTGLGVDVQGALAFAADTTNNVVTTFPLTTMAILATPSGNSVASGSQPVSLAVDPLGRFVYTANLLDFSLSVYSVNRNFTALTPGTRVNLGLSVPPKMPRAAIVDPSGQYLYVADEMGKIFAFSINQTSGALSTVGSVVAGNHPFALGIARFTF